MLKLLGTHIEFITAKRYIIDLCKKPHSFFHIANDKRLNARITLLPYIF